MKTPHISFVWDWDNTLEYILGWKDGLAAALKEISGQSVLSIHTQTHGMHGFAAIPHEYFSISCHQDYNSIKTSVARETPDVVVVWGDLTRPSLKHFAENYKTILLFSGGPVQIMPWMKNIDHVFVENEVYREQFAAAGMSSSIAFGCNTTLFSPKEKQKHFDIFFPATYAAWKRHHLFARLAAGRKAVTCGHKVLSEPQCYDVVDRAGALALEHRYADQMVELYARSRCVVVPSAANGGSQRTVLEALSMNIPCVVAADSDKNTELIYNCGQPSLIAEPNVDRLGKAVDNALASTQPINTRDLVLDQYSEFVYAKKIMEKVCELS